MVTGMAQTVWILAELRRCTPEATAHLDWSGFSRAATPKLFVWEAFVTGAAKGKDHAADARRAVAAFEAALPDPSNSSMVKPDGDVFSVIGAALLRTGWSNDLGLLRRACIVLAPVERGQSHLYGTRSARRQ